MRFSFWWAASCHLVRDAMGSTQQLSSHMEMSNSGLQKFIWYSFLSGGSSGAVWCYDEGTGAPLLREGLPGTGTACPGRLGNLPPWRCSQKPPGHGRGQKAVGNPAWAILRFCDFQEASDPKYLLAVFSINRKTKLLSAHQNQCICRCLRKRKGEAAQEAPK